MDAETRQQFDRLIGHLEGMSSASRSRFDRLEARMAIEQRMDVLETRVEGIERSVDRLATGVSEGRIGMDERFASLTLRIELFEQRTSEALTALTQRVDRLAARVGALENGLFALNGRVDALANDMRQRFRVVNDRHWQTSRRRRPR